MPGALTLGSYVNEVIVHTWDLAKATGQTPGWSNGALQVALDAISIALSHEVRAQIAAGVAAARGTEHEWEPPFGPFVEVPIDAPLIDRVVAWSGRHP
jgi:hypothetical protein